MKDRSWLKSVGFAIQGLITAFVSERHLRIHLCFALLVLLAAYLWQVKPLEWALLFLAISLVLVAELINTAIEKTIDLTQEHFHPLAKMAKDVAAGAVLVAALTSVIIGILVFTPYLSRCFFN